MIQIIETICYAAIGIFFFGLLAVFFLASLSAIILALSNYARRCQGADAGDTPKKPNHPLTSNPTPRRRRWM